MVSTDAPLVAAVDPVPEELLLKWRELVAKLRDEQSKVWPDLGATLELNRIEAFAARLRDWGESYGAESLRRFGVKLLQEAQQFNLDQLPKSLDAFPQLIEELAAQCDRAGQVTASK